MTAPEIDSTDELTPEEQQYGENPNLKQLRAKAKKYDGVEKELNDLRREMAFTKAGIPDSPTGKLFREAYKGDPEVEAVRKSASEYGVIEASQVPDDELDAADRVAALGHGGGAGKPAPDMNSQLRRAAGRS